MGLAIRGAGRGALLAATIVAVATTLAPPARAGGAPGTDVAGVPFAPGDRFAASWVVTAVDRQAEYVRLSLTDADGATRTVVEVSYRRGDPDAWSTAHYRVQPAPGASPPEALLADVLRRVRTIDDASRDAPFVRLSHTRPAGVPPEPRGEAAAWSWPVAAGLLAIAALAFVLLGRSPRARGRLEPISRRLFRPWETSLERLARCCGPAPEPAAGRRDWLFALLAAGAAYALLIAGAGPVPLGLDTVGDFARARDCVEGSCRLAGPVASVWDLRQGTGWILVLAACRHLGLGITGALHVAAALLAAAAGVVYLSASRLFGRREALLAALASAWLGARMTHFPALWAPTPAPLPLALWVLASLAFVRTGRLPWAVLSGAALGLAADAHIVNLGLVPFEAGLLAVAARAPAAAIPAGLAGLASMLIVFSGGTHVFNLSRFADSGMLVPAAAALAAACGLGLALRAPFRETRHPALHLLAAGCVYCAALILPEAAVATSYQAYYGLALAIFAMPLGAALLLRAAARADEARRGPGGRRPLTWAVWSAGMLLCTLRLAFPNVTPHATWSLRDAQTLAHALFERGYAYEDLVRRLQGPDVGPLLSGIGLFEPSRRAPRGRLQDDLFVELRGARDAAGDPPPTQVVDLGGGRRAALWHARGWVEREQFTVCYAAGGVRSCLATGFDRETAGRLDPHASRQERTFTPMLRPSVLREAAVRRSSGSVVAEYVFAVSAGPAGERRTVESVGPWRITAVSGVSCPERLPSGRVTLQRGDGDGRGTITLALRTDDETAYLDEKFPPAVLERPAAAPR